MKEKTSDSGFTLVEMLVGLVVLSFFAIILGTTLSGSFKSYEAVNSKSKTVIESHFLRKALNLSLIHI